MPYLVGTRVKIVAADEFFGYCDQWEGTVQGVNSGLIEVNCKREDGMKTLFVPPGQLARLD